MICICSTLLTKLFKNQDSEELLLDSGHDFNMLFLILVPTQYIEFLHNTRLVIPMYTVFLYCRKHDKNYERTGSSCNAYIVEHNHATHFAHHPNNSIHWFQTNLNNLVLHVRKNLMSNQLQYPTTEMFSFLCTVSRSKIHWISRPPYDICQLVKQYNIVFRVNPN